MTKRGMTVGWCVLGLGLSDAAPASGAGQAATTERTFRLSEGVTLYVVNPDGKDFTVSLDVRDLNLFANGPREMLFKVYDPDGVPVVREIIPDDGCGDANFPDRIGGWDHELQYYANLYAKGTTPSFRWSAWSEPGAAQDARGAHLRPADQGRQEGRVPDRPGRHAGPSTSRCACRRTCRYGFAGHPTFMQGHGDLLKKAYIYVPKGTSGLFFAFAEPDMPRTRRFKLTAPGRQGALRRPGGRRLHVRRTARGRRPTAAFASRASTTASS